MPASPRVIGRYALYDEIAAGGMATVYFGRLLGPVGFSRTVAIKRLHPQFAKDPEFVAMFLDEARIAARIRHPNVVPTLDVVATDGELFLVMDYVQGEALSRLARRRSVPPRIAASIMCGVLHGLHAAHEARSEQGEPLEIVHRDVSPQNVLVGVDGTARVLDFGVAKAQGRSQTTREGQIKGKLAYMAPEQVRGTATRQTDIYAAAVVTWEALVGRRLFAGDDEAATLARVLFGEVVAPSEAAPEVPKVFDEVVMRGLATAPAQRWATAREMALALERCAGVASPSEVGEWVESLASNALSRRTLTLNGIESSSFKLSADASSLAARHADAASAEPAAAEAPVPSQAPSSSTGTSNVSVGDLPVPGRARSGALYVAGALLALTVAVVALLLRGPDDKAAATYAAPSAPPVTPASAAVAPPPPPAAPATPTASASAAASAHEEPPSSAKAAPATTTHLAHPPAGAKPGSASCNPPYTTDAQGHRHYKMECL